MSTKNNLVTRKPNTPGDDHLSNSSLKYTQAPVDHHLRSKPWHASLPDAWSGIFIFFSLLSIPILLLIIVAAIFGYYQTPGRIVPGVSVGSTNVGGLLITDAALKLQTSWNTEKQITLSNGMQVIRVAPAQLGLSLDSVRNIEQAYQIGHTDSLIHRFGHFLVGARDGWQIAPIINFDEVTARKGLETLAPVLSKAARDASIRIEGERLVAVPGEMGYTINIEETLAVIKNNPTQVMGLNILQVVILPILPQVSDLSPILSQAEQFIHTPASFGAYDALSDEYMEFNISKDTLISWLTIEINDQGPRIGLDEGKIQDTLQVWQSNLGGGRYFEPEQTSQQIAEAVENGQQVTVIIKHSPTTYTVQPGDTLIKIGWNMGFPAWKIIQANPGLDPDKLLMGSELTIPSKDEMLPLPIVLNKRIVISIQKQRLWVYQDGKSISVFVISTGIDRSPTQPGIYQVQTHEKNAYASVWDLYMPHFLGIYEAWPGFMNGIHGLPTLSNGQRLWANILGKPASYGCIILDLDEAKWLYEWAEAGVVVEIQS